MNDSRNISAKQARAGGSSDRPQFSLAAGPDDLDPRIDAFRDDIADIALADRIAVPHYVKPARRRIVAPVADLRTDPDPGSELGSQLLCGEGFALLDLSDGWAWGYGEHDHFVGFVPVEAIGAAGDPPTHRIAVASVDSGSGVLYLGSPVAGTVEGDRLTLAGGGSVALAECRAIDDPVGDPAGVAALLTGAPYLLGGRSVEGIDCSGLVQIAYAMAGVSVPRDSDMQLADFGVDIGEDEALARGDLVFFPAHVGIMLDPETLLHASGHAGKVLAEPLAAVIARIGEKHAQPVLARRRAG